MPTKLLVDQILAKHPGDSWYDKAADGDDQCHGRDAFTLGRQFEPELFEPVVARLVAPHEFDDLDQNKDGKPSRWQVKHALVIASLAQAQRDAEDKEWLKSFVDSFGPVAKYRPATVHPRTAPGKPAMREAIRDLALHFWTLREQIAYSQGRPIWGVRPFFPKTKLTGDWLWDCSGFVTYLYRNGTQGKVDINGNGWSGYGYTGTQIVHGSKVAVPKMADLAFYWTDDNPAKGIGHVAIFVEGGLDARVVSMGSTPGPLLLPGDYRPIAQIRRYI